MRAAWMACAAALLIAFPAAAQNGTWEADFAEGWTTVGGHSYWRADDGRYVFEGTGWSRHMTVAPVLIIDGTITVRATPMAESAAHGWTMFGVVAKYASSANHVAVRFGAYDSVSVYMFKGGQRSITRIGSFEAEVGHQYEARLVIEGDQLRTFLDGEELEAVTIPSAGEPGRVGLYTETPMACEHLTVEGAMPPSDAPAEEIEGTPETSVEFATFQPDPVAPGEAIPVRGQLHVYVRNSGDGPAVLDGITIDGRSADDLIEAGLVEWYDQHPRAIRPDEVGRVTLRTSGIPQERAEALMAGGSPWAAEVELRHLKAEPAACTATIGADTEPLRINMLTFGEDLRTVTAYLQAPDTAAGGFTLDAVAVDGRDVTGLTTFAAKRVAAEVVPVTIALEEPLTEGRDVTVTVRTAEGLSCGHTLRAFPSEFPLQVCLFDQIRSDAIEDIANHCFTDVAPRNTQFLEPMLEHDLSMLAFGGGLPALLRWWRPDYPEIIAFWLDEKDEHPVMDTIRVLDEAHSYYRAEGRYIPRQMINLVNPWSGTGMGFMDIMDVVCHGYGMAGAANGRDFPLLSSLPWRELRAGRRPWWPYFRSAEVALSVDPQAREVLGLSPGTQRVIEPAQERMMTFGCLQLGAKGVCHWAYGVRGGDSTVYYVDGPGLRLSMGGVPWPTSRTVRGYEVPEEICRDLKATWDEIGRINAVLRTIGPWVADSDPSPIAQVTGSTPAESVAGGPAAQASALLSGQDTVVLVALNLNIDTEWTGRDADGFRSYEPVDATVQLTLPEWIEPREVFSVSEDGLGNVSPARDGRTLEFDLPGLAIERVIVVTADPEVREQMQQRLADMQERLRAMEAHVPVPAEE